MLMLKCRVVNFGRAVVGCVVGAATVVALAASPADASAVGYAKVSGFCIPVKDHEVCLPTISLGHFIQGDDRRITRQEASVQDTVGADSTGLQWCNWRIDWRYGDTNGRTYLRSRGPMHNKCTFGASIGRVDRSKRTLKHYGKACADFVVNGTTRASQCHYITK
jgi:hypothetical protein